MVINKTKTLDSMFMDHDKPVSELREFSTRGIEDLLEIYERKFVPLMSMIAVNNIAAIQLIVGGLLVPTGFGATIGMGLISEEVTDLFTSNRAYYTREFSWSNYIQSISVSLVISAASAGWKSMKDAVIGGKNL